jgi:ribosomal protein S18 acetylase RimI-like enzyme
VQCTLRRATPADAAGVHALLVAAGRDLATRGFLNWSTPYPREKLDADVVSREVYVAFADDDARQRRPAATFTLGATPARADAPTHWLVPHAPARYLNRLAVDPALQGRGLGGWCLERIEEIAHAAGASAVRCEVLRANSVVRRLYERHGYEERGEWHRPDWTFTCYERMLDG